MGITIVWGAQYGSEGKGQIAFNECHSMDIAVRLGGPNAGHTFFFQKDKAITMQQIPCAWPNPQCTLVLGKNAVIGLEVLLNEIEVVKKLIYDLEGRLMIDYRALVVTDEEILKEQGYNLDKKIGSTSARAKEGISTARCDEILRAGNARRAQDVKELEHYVSDTVLYLREATLNNREIMIEGSQGYKLGLKTGYYPFVTSTDVDPMSLMAGAGIDPCSTYENVDVRSIAVFRSYPIRVAGNSGPFDPDSEEITWEELTRRVGATEPIMENTSVTKLPRRVATFSFSGLDDVTLNTDVSEIALTFADYIDWLAHNKREITPKIWDFIRRIERQTDIPVNIVTTGPDTFMYTDLENR